MYKCVSVGRILECSRKRDIVYAANLYLIAGPSSAKKEGDFGIFTACTIKDNLRFNHLI